MSASLVERLDLRVGPADQESPTAAKHANPADLYRMRGARGSRVVLTIRRDDTFTLTVDLEDDEPAWLMPILEALTELLRLPANWNSYGAQQIDPYTAFFALTLLAATMRDDMPMPAVVPTHRGGVQFEWHMRGIDLEVNVLSRDRFTVGYEDMRQQVEWEREFTTDLEPLQTALAELSERG